MPYTPSTFVDGSTAVPVDAAELNKIGTGLSKAPYGPDGTANQVPVADGAGGWTLQTLTDAQISAIAAIAVSKIAGYPSDATKFLRGDGTWSSQASQASELDYAQITAAPSAITATTEGTSVAVVTGNAVTYDGSSLYVEFFVPLFTCDTGNRRVNLVFYRDSTVLGQVAVFSLATANNFPIFAKVKDTPTAASHTYKVSAFVTSAGSFTPQAGAGGSGVLTPAFMRVVKA